jgi:hypothetical protein
MESDLCKRKLSLTLTFKGTCVQKVKIGVGCLKSDYILKI